MAVSPSAIFHGTGIQGRGQQRDFFKSYYEGEGQRIAQTDIGYASLASQELMQGRQLEFGREQLAETEREFDISELFRRDQLTEEARRNDMWQTETHHEHELGYAKLAQDLELGTRELDIKEGEVSGADQESAFMRELLAKQWNLQSSRTAPLSDNPLYRTSNLYKPSVGGSTSPDYEIDYQQYNLNDDSYRATDPFNKYYKDPFAKFR